MPTTIESAPPTLAPNCTGKVEATSLNQGRPTRTARMEDQ